jgi:hypothetical protein
LSDPLRKVVPGSDLVIHARTWNQFLDATRAFRDARLGGGPRARRGALPSDVARDGDIVRVANATGVDLPRRSVVGLAGPIFAPGDSEDAFLREVAFRGVVPSEAHTGKFAVLLEPAPPDRVVRAFVSGVTQARLSVSDPSLACADVAPGSTDHLVTKEGGSAQVLWRESDDAAYAAEHGYGGVEWAIVRLGTSCGGGAAGAAPGRCACPEDTYEVEVECGDCGRVYGPRKMPKYWWLTILSAGAASYGDGDDAGYAYDPCGVPCEALAGKRYRLANQADGEGNPSCTWLAENGALCVSVELTPVAVGNEEYWRLTIADRDGCVLAILYKRGEDFDCCGLNAGWTPDPGNVCDLEVELAPDPCTCCPDDDCPPGDDRTCPEVCCENVCHLVCRWTANCPASTCPEPPGDCVPLPTCTSSGEVGMTWVGGCRWYGREKDLTATPPFDREAVWEGSGGAWTLTIRVLVSGHYCTFVFHASAWDCADPPTLVFDRPASTCSGSNVTAALDPAHPNP